MGQYLSAPITDKESAEEENDRLAYGMSSMQGWRVSMEDAHINVLDVDGHQTALFSVFDGHGGKAVAKYAAKHMPYWLVRTEAFNRKEFGIAIAESYYKLDELLDSEEGQAELKLLAGKNNNNGGRGRGGGLFTDLEDKLDSGDMETAADAVLEPGQDAGAAEPAETKPKDSSSRSKFMKRSDSSEEFRKSALTRHSVIPLSPEERKRSKKEQQEALNTLETLDSVSTNESDSADLDDEFDSHSATGMGCTAVSVLVHGNSVIVANTGDSRCVISRKGEATPLTLDHKPIIYEEAQRIIKAGGFVRDNRVNGALNVSRTIGDLDFKRNSELPHTEQMVVATPDITELELQPGDEFLILACDGIWDVMSNQEAVDFVRKRIKQGQGLKEICEAMCDFCLAPDLKGLCRGADNMSVIVVLFKKHADLDSFWQKLWSSFTCLFSSKGR